MTTVTITVTATTAFSASAGTVAGEIKYSVSNSSGVFEGTVSSTSSTGTITISPDLVPGTYVASAQQLDTNGGNVGSAASADFTIVSPGVTISVPSTISVTVS